MFADIHRLTIVCFLTVSAALPQAGKLEVRGSLRTRLEMWDWFEGAGDNSYAYSGNLLRLGIGQQRVGWDWQVEFAAPLLFGLPDGALAPAPQLQLGLGANYYAANENSRNAANLFPKQAFLRLKDLGSPANSLRLGRFEFLDGAEVAPADPTLAAVKRDRIAQRLIGNFGWSHVGRSFDGAHFVRNTADTNITLVGAVPTRGVFQVDGWGNLDVAIGYGAITRQVPRKRSKGEWRLFSLYYQDWRNVVKTDNRPLAIRALDRDDIRIASFGGHYIHAHQTNSGTVDLMAWGALQAGTWGVLDHLAGALALEAGWQPPGLPRLRPWLRAGMYYGTGDGNPSDGDHGTFFQFLPTPRVYARFPFFNMMNNRDLFLSGILRPHRTVTIKSEARFLTLASRDDLWYLGGGAFQPDSFGFVGRPSQAFRGLANLYDVSIDWQASSAILVTGYVGHARGRGVVRAIYPEGTDATLGCLELVYRF
ncbi:MAG TPA: alginate export family protein [Bryobacteraceae bacterium]|nr:alginate export family protein [Bryobacteraceae bacterium]